MAAASSTAERLLRDPKKCIVNFNTPNGSTFKAFFDCVSSLITQNNLIFEPDGIMLEALTPIVYAYAHMPKELLGDYSCKKRTVVGIDFSFVFKLLRTLGPSDGLAIQIPEEQSVTAPTVEFNIINAKRIIMTHEYRTLDIDEATFALPQITFDCCAYLPADDFQRYMRTTENVGEDVQIVAKVTDRERTLHIYCNGMNSSMHIRVPFENSFDTEPLAATSIVEPADDEEDADSKITMSEKEKRAAGVAIPKLKTYQRTSDKLDKYAMRILLSIAKCATMSSAVYIYLRPEYALLLRYSIGTMGTLTWCIAPRVDPSDHNLSMLDMGAGGSGGAGDEEDDEDNDVLEEAEEPAAKKQKVNEVDEAEVDEGEADGENEDQEEEEDGAEVEEETIEEEETAC
jgi:hypothetical protein